MVQIPAMYSDRQLRVEYAAAHYWDAFLSTDESFACDSSLINGVRRQELEGQFANYAALLINAGIEIGRKSVDALFTKVEAFQKAVPSANVFSSFETIVKNYLFDANSPYREEDLYGVYAGRLAASGLTPPEMVPAYAHDAQLCALNSIGGPAADFRYADAAGRRHRLYDIKAEYTLLFFSNPGCEACKEIIEALKGVPSLSELVNSGRLAVVNIYIDEDIQAWRDYLDHYPDGWHNGYDPSYTIRTDVTYNVRAIPSLYLLDDAKTVILKDAPQERIFAFLDNLAG